MGKTKWFTVLRWQLCALALMLGVQFTASAAVEWPQEVLVEKGKVVVYQPQPEKLEGNLLTGRSAMSLEMEAHPEPIFGVFWFKARIDTDRDAGTANVHTIEITKVRWPESKEADEQRFTQLIESNLAQSGFDISMASLSASLTSADMEMKSLANLKNDPPEIIFKDTLSVLLMFDGKPRFEPIKNSGYQRAVNTPYLVAGDINNTHYYLSNGTEWYASQDPLGPWGVTMTVPSSLVNALQDEAGERGLSNTSSLNFAPEVVTATKPTELIVSDGKPKWETLVSGDILYVSNTETPWLRELSDSNMYILLSGRWFRSKTEAGPWVFVRPDELPSSFSNIPPASDIGGVRTSVAGTEEAEDAILDSQIPQTSAINRSEASLTVEYDGKPDFKKIPNTKVAYAVNTGAQVLLIDKKYYAVDNGVWFVSSSATGPWVVADDIPEEAIAEIPPSAPVYNTKYVHVYHSTPTVVYVGYTPGYMWSFPYYGVPVYGSGWYYPPYVGGIYYPRPPTWGLHVGYNPWTGWNYGVTWSNGFLTVGFRWSAGYHHHHHGHGWYGGGYRRPVHIHTGDINVGKINIGNTINAGNRDNISNKIANRPNTSLNNVNKGNLYNRSDNAARNANRANLNKGFNNARPANNRANNIYADREGNVARRQNNTWQTRDQNKWKNDSSLSPRISTQDISSPKPKTNNTYQSSNRNNQNINRQNTSRQNTNRQPSHYNSGQNSSRQNNLNRSYQSRQHGAAMHQQRTQTRGGGRRR